jgi:hypothetical protein
MRLRSIVAVASFPVRRVKGSSLARKHHLQRLQCKVAGSPELPSSQVLLGQALASSFRFEQVQSIGAQIVLMHL